MSLCLEVMKIEKKKLKCTATKKTKETFSLREVMMEIFKREVTNEEGIDRVCDAIQRIVMDSEDHGPVTVELHGALSEKN